MKPWKSRTNTFSILPYPLILHIIIVFNEHFSYFIFDDTVRTSYLILFIFNHIHTTYLMTLYCRLIYINKYVFIIYIQKESQQAHALIFSKIWIVYIFSKEQRVVSNNEIILKFFAEY